MYSFSSRKCKCRATCPCSMHSTALSTPSTPAAVSACPKFVLALPITRLAPRPVPCPSASDTACTSIGSPSDVPVPCASSMPPRSLPPALSAPPESASPATARSAPSAHCSARPGSPHVPRTLRQHCPLRPSSRFTNSAPQPSPARTRSPARQTSCIARPATTSRLAKLTNVRRVAQRLHSKAQRAPLLCPAPHSWLRKSAPPTTTSTPCQSTLPSPSLPERTTLALPPCFPQSRRPKLLVRLPLTASRLA